MSRSPNEYYRQAHADAGLPMPDEYWMDLATRCSICQGFRYVSGPGVVTPAYICDVCVALS